MGLRSRRSKECVISIGFQRGAGKYRAKQKNNTEGHTIKRFFFIIIASFGLLLAAYLAYLNEVELPKLIKSTIITGLESSTGKRVTVDSAKLNIFKGLVIKGLAIADDKSQILAAKNISCRFLIIPIFKKEVVVTSLKFDSPHILVERQPDNSINIVELFFKNPIFLMNGKFSLTISGITLSKADISFRDKVIDGEFVKDINNADVRLRLKLPDKVSFNAEFQIPSKIPALIKSSGEYKVIKKELSLKIEAKDLYPRDFVKYLDEKKFKIPDGRIDADITLDYKDSIFNADMDVSGIEMKFTEGRVEARLNSRIKAKMKYDVSNNELIYTGSADIKNLALCNLDMLDKIYDIRGHAVFSDKNYVFNDITATVLGLPVSGTAAIEDLQNPILKINVVSDVDLNLLKDMLKNKFGMNLPVEFAEGQGGLNLVLQYKIPIEEGPILNGSVSIVNAAFMTGYNKFPIEDLKGRFDFTQNQLLWKDVFFRYDGADYRTSGVLTNFQKPGVQLEVYSKNLTVKSLFSVNDKLIVLSNLDGHYNDYGFSINGDINTADPKDIKADIGGSLTFKFSENKEPYKSFKDKLKNLKPSGEIKTKFTLKGNLNDISGSTIEAEAKCDKLSLNSFKLDNFVSNFTQRNGVANIKYIHAGFYGGTIEGNGLIDFKSKDTPYQVNADLKGVKIEYLKKETAFKDKDVAGLVQAHLGIKGFLGDSSRLNAWGKIKISKGKLWQLNLFHGIGALLLRSDFSSVLFEEGSCDFFIKDKSIFTNDLMMKSSLINLYGAVKISFDRAIAASLRTEFTDEGVDAARASNIAGAIERYSVIEVKGTLDKPEYKLRPDLSTVVSDIADNFFAQ